MKGLGIITRWLFILCFPVLLLTATVTWAANSLWVYEHGFEKYNVSQTTGLAESELDKVARELISYFNSDEEFITLTIAKDGQPIELFTERDIIHLWEVKTLLRSAYYLLGGTLAFIIIYGVIMLHWRKGRAWQTLASGILKGSILTLALVVALALGVIFAFDQLFWWFHKIVFLFYEGNYWILDPAKDYLIRLFPPYPEGGFWFDAFLLCGGIIAGLAAVFCGVSGGYLLSKRRRTVSY